MIEVFGGTREAAIAREVTKLYETNKRGTLLELAEFVSGDSNQQKGEIVLIVAGKPKTEQELDTDVTELLERLAQELPAKRAAAVVADWSGLRKKALYDHLLAAKGEQGE